jgi:hypothetical protein
MDEIDSLRARALDEIAVATSSEELNAARISVLGRNGTLTVRLRALRYRDDEAAVQSRRVLNGVKTELTRVIGKRRQALKTATEEPASKGPEPQTADPRRSLMTAWFLGPKSENATIWQESFQYIFQDYVNWRRNYFPTDPVVVTRERRRDHYEWLDTLNGELDGILARLKAHYPFYSPRYIAHMLSEQTLPSVLGYFAGMLYNPNNVTDEAAPVTVELELEAGQLVAAMLGFNPSTAWTHICSGGTDRCHPSKQQVQRQQRRSPERMRGDRHEARRFRLGCRALLGPQSSKRPRLRRTRGEADTGRSSIPHRHRSAEKCHLRAATGTVRRSGGRYRRDNRGRRR